MSFWTMSETYIDTVSGIQYAADTVLQKVVLVGLVKLHPGGHAFDPDNAKQIGTNAAQRRPFVVVVVVKIRRTVPPETNSTSRLACEAAEIRHSGQHSPAHKHLNHKKEGRQRPDRDRPENTVDPPNVCD